MRLLAVAAMLVIDLPPAFACNKPHPSPENPTIILGLLGVSIIMWSYAGDRSAK